MSRVAVVHASRHGGTEGIARRIGEVLESAGVDVVITSAEGQPDVAGSDAVVIGSGVYLGRWLQSGLEFLERNRDLLAARSVWLFSSGPVSGSAEDASPKDALTRALGPEDGPGSGGRKRIAALSAEIRPRDHRVFGGVFNPGDRPASMLERIVRIMPASRRALRAGDFRDWAAIEAWAGGIADDVKTGHAPRAAR